MTLSPAQQIGNIVKAENQTLAAAMRRHHFTRYFQYLRIEACCKKNQALDLAKEAKERALYHRRLADACTQDN